MTRRRRRRPPRNDPPGSLYPTLDLHGFTAAEAVAAARRWLEIRRVEGDSVVRLITGRGLHSSGAPVLPAEIEHLLASETGTLVAGYEQEGGGGSYRIRLRPGSPAWPMNKPAPRRDPTLVREAEEALVELGITPTPELLEAEIRRIIEEKGSQAE